MQPATNMRLNRTAIPSLDESIAVPQYDVSRVEAGIVHVGVGGFHRAHEAMYVDAYMNVTGDTSWGICGVGLREADRHMQSRLKEQDYLYTLVEKHANGDRKARVIGALTDFLIAGDSPVAIIDKMASEAIKIVSLTITEGGYNFDPTTGEFIAQNPDVQHDLANPESPKLVFGYVTAALKKRKEMGIAPFTVMSCDNIQHNGDVLKAMLLSYIRLADTDFAQWVEENVSFPNSMVDRITPATTDEDKAALVDSGIEDSWPVVCEPFDQWIIADKFCNERPAFEDVGAQFVDNVAPYEKLKLRMLNAGHSVLGLTGSLADLDTIHESVAQTELRSLLATFMVDEVMPTLDPVAGIDVHDYKNILLARFANPYIKDSLSRICLESSAKIPVFLLPTIRENLANGGKVDISALILAAWSFYSDKRTSQKGTPLVIQDQLADELHQAASRYQDDPLSFLKVTSVFGDLSDESGFTPLFKDYLSRIYSGESILDIAKSLTSAPSEPALV